MAVEFEARGFSDALVILGSAGLVIPAFARFRITPVIGFILVGVVVGPFGLGALVVEVPWLEWITISNPKGLAPYAELGIILLLFSIGLELSFNRLWTMRRRLFGFGSTELIGSGLIIGIALYAFGTTASASIGIGLALALSSTALVLPIAGTQSAVGKLALAMLLFEDLALVPIIFLLGAIGPSSAGEGWEQLASVIGIGILVVGAMLVVGRWLIPPMFAQAARTKSPELFLSTSLLIVILASLATAVVGLSAIVGAIVAGLLIAETKYRVEVETMTAPFRGLGLGVFLITVGMSLDLQMIVDNWLSILGAVIGVVLIKSIVTTALLRIGGVSRGVATETGVLMAAPSETTLIVLGAATQAGLIADDTATFWQVVTAIGLTITPILARVGHDAARRVEWRHADRAEPPPSTTEPRTILIGFGRVGQMVADMLDTHNRPYLAIEADVDIVTIARRAGKPVRFGDAARPAMLDSLDLDTASAVVMTMDDPVQTLRLAKTLRGRHPDLTIVSRARDTQHAAELYRAGVTDAVPETLESSLQLSEAVLVDLGVAMGPVIASIHEKRDELRAEIKKAGDLDELPRLGPLRARQQSQT
jgi:monovalent cation:H+ antiporter-2, CPA2 family